MDQTLVNQYIPKFRTMRNAMGAEAFERMALNLAKEQEPILRKRNPEHPMLKMLDEHRAKGLR